MEETPMREAIFGEKEKEKEIEWVSEGEEDDKGAVVRGHVVWEWTYGLSKLHLALLPPDIYTTLLHIRYFYIFKIPLIPLKILFF